MLLNPQGITTATLRELEQEYRDDSYHTITTPKPAVYTTADYLYRELFLIMEKMTSPSDGFYQLVITLQDRLVSKITSKLVLIQSDSYTEDEITDLERDINYLTGKLAELIDLYTEKRWF